MPKLHIFRNEKETCYAFVEWLVDLSNDVINKYGRFTIAISGSDIPKPVYKILATEYTDKIDWTKVHIFTGDETCISYTDEKNNSASALKILIDQVPIPKNQIHIIKTADAPDEAAKQYEELLHSYFEDGENAFDLVILGLGEQGNLLSIFPYEDESDDRSKWVMPVYDKQEEVFKVTLTIAAINASSMKAFLVTGKRKEDVVQRVLKGKYDPEKNPAQLIVTPNKPVYWFLDEGAAGKLIKPTS